MEKSPGLTATADTSNLAFLPLTSIFKPTKCSHEIETYLTNHIQLTEGNFMEKITWTDSHS